MLPDLLAREPLGRLVLWVQLGQQVQQEAKDLLVLQVLQEPLVAKDLLGLLVQSVLQGLPGLVLPDQWGPQVQQDLPAQPDHKDQRDRQVPLEQLAHKVQPDQQGQRALLVQQELQALLALQDHKDPLD